MKSPFAVAVIALLAIGVAACGPREDKPPPTPKVAGEVALPRLGAAPAWQLTDLEGKVVSAETLKGKVVVLDFWATWCGPCKMEIPGYIEMTKKYGPDGLVIVGISMDQAGPEVVKDFVAKNKMNYPVAMVDEKVFEALGGYDAIPAIPTTFLIDRDGQIRDRKVGAEESASYERKILALLK